MDPKTFKRQLLATFKAQLDEHIASMNRILLELEKSPAEDRQETLIAELFRGAHSVKGAARAVKVKDIEVIAHRMEDIMGAIRTGILPLTREVTDRFLSGLDALGACMEAHLQGTRMPGKACDGVVHSLESVFQNGVQPEPRPLQRETEPSPGLLQKDEPDQKEAPGAISGAAEAPPVQQTPDMMPGGKPGEGPNTEPAAPVRSVSAVGETIRVNTEKLDRLMAVTGELLVARMRNHERLEEMKGIQESLCGLEKVWRGIQHRFRQLPEDPLDPAPFDALAAHIRRTVASLDAGNRRLKSWFDAFEKDSRHLSLITDDMQTGVRRLRMVPVATLFDAFPRMVRDLARDRGKTVAFDMEGTDTEIDRQVLEIMRDPLTHLLRNAVDHGIEPPDEREVKGKPWEGRVVLRAAQQGNHIVLGVSDDGRGIDLPAVKRAAGKAGLRDRKVLAAMGENETLGLLFHAGLSTAETVTEISGRGIGLDIVRHNLEQLHGRVAVETYPGQGTTFTLFLPLTLATSHVLLMEVAGQTVAVPTNTVERILHMDPEQVGSIDGKPTVSLHGHCIPMIRMADALELPVREPSTVPGRHLPVVVLGSAEKRMAFAVTRFLSTQEVVVKNLGPQLKRVRNIAGATILGTGQMVVILNAAALMKSAQAVSHTASAPEITAETAPRKRVLVVDDSITTRTLEKNILENAGYQVLVAADGVEGWELVQSEPLDAMVLDVDMPRMDGFSLTEKIRSDKRWEELPVILVTSLESQEHRIRGMEAGADAYITKGTFDQQDLLKTIERLVG